MEISTAPSTDRKLSSLEERALALLAHHNAATVASALGVSESYISQLLSDDYFAEKVKEARIQVLAKHDARDATYDQIEDELLNKFKKSLALMYRPSDILKAISVINAAKRRGGAATAGAASQTAQVVPLILPAAIVQQFTVNTANQVISTGQQTLLTIQSNNLDHLVNGRKNGQNVAALDAPTSSKD